MRYLTYAFLAAIGVILISVSLANRTAVQLNLVPDGLVDILGFQASAKTVQHPALARTRDARYLILGIGLKSRLF